MVRGDSWITGCAILLSRYPEIERLPYRVIDLEVAVRNCAHMMDLIVLERSRRKASDREIGLNVEDET